MATTIQIGTSFEESPVISANGQYAVFRRFDEIYIRDLFAGENSLISVSSEGEVGNGTGSGSFDSIAISADGRFVAFESESTNLVPNDTNGESDLFLRDVVAGTTTLVSLDSDGSPIPANLFGFTFRPSISADGRFVAFESEALFAGSTREENIGENIFVRDVISNTTELISVSSDGVEGNAVSSSASISADGRFVAFESLADNLVAEDNLSNDFDVFVRDRQNQTTIRASVNSQGEKGSGVSENQIPNAGGATNPVISPDGSYVVFESGFTNLVPNDTNGVRDIFRHDLQTRETTRISIDSNGNEANGGSRIGFGKSAISADGRYIVFQSGANNLVEGDTNNATDVFVRDIVEGTTTRVSVNSNGEEPVGGFLETSSYDGTISGDGSFIVFESNGSNMNDEGIDTHLIYLRDTRESTEEPPTALTLTGGTAQIAYVAYYGRPADNLGLEFWNDILTENEVSYAPINGDLLTGSEPEVYDRIVNDFGTSEEADRLFGIIDNNRDKVNRVYQFAFNRDGDEEGLNYWTEQIDNGNVTLATFALEVALGARNDDIVVLNHKIDSADLFSNSIDTQAEIDAYSGSSAEIFGRNWLDDYGVTTSSQAEVDLALTSLVNGDF